MEDLTVAFNECFVCFHDDREVPVFKVCQCNTYIHKKCFRRLVRLPAHSTHCPVCQQQYDLVETKRVKCYKQPTLLYLATLTMSVIILYIQYWALFLSNATSNMIAVTNVSGGMALLAMFIGLINITGEMEHSCCCEIEQQRTRVLTENP